jgi:type IV pilus assembly protein PilV
MFMTRPSDHLRHVSMQSAARQQGFTLLEILVSIVVLSIGLLGLAGLQAVSLNNNQTAYLRAIATQQALDIADRIRSNPAGVTSGEYDDLDTSIPTAQTCLSSSCTAAQMATSDQARWNTNNQRLLPGGAGTVVDDGAGGFIITVMWNEKGAVFNDPNCPEDTAENTRCFVTRMSP